MPPVEPRPAGLSFVVVLLVLEGVLLLAGGVAAILWRDNELVDLPVLLAEVDEVGPFTVETEVWQVALGAGIVLLLLGILALVVARGLWRGNSLAWGLVLVMSALHLAGAVASWVAYDGYGEWGGIGSVVVSALVILALLTPAARRFVTAYA